MIPLSYITHWHIMKRILTLTENDLTRMIREYTRKAVNEAQKMKGWINDEYAENPKFNPIQNENKLRKIIRESVDDALASIKDTFSTRNNTEQRYAMKYENAVNTIEYYTFLVHDGHTLNKKQYQQIEDAIDFLRQTDTGDNPTAQEWIQTGTDLLTDHE